MSKNKSILERMENRPQNVRFADLIKICDLYFGEARHKGSSHYIYKTLWHGDPRVNIQSNKNGTAKAYQVKQVLKAIIVFLIFIDTSLSVGFVKFT